MNLAISLEKKFGMKRIIGIGNALVDIITLIDNDLILDEFSLPKGSMQLVDLETSRKVKTGTINLKKQLASGGSAANTIHGLSMLKSGPGFIGSVGIDDTGAFFEKDMKDAGVSTILFKRNSATGTAVALISPDSERTFATHLGAAVELNAEEIKPEFFKGYDILYLEGYLILNKPLVEKACKIAKDLKMQVALDLSSYNVVEARIDDFREITGKYVDIIFANEDEAKSFTGLDPLDAVYELSSVCDIAVVKAGKDGSWIKRGDEIYKIDPNEVQCVDTTGAGDLYSAGFLYGLASGLSLEKCGVMGSYLAERVIGIIGARMDEKMWMDINEVVKAIMNS